MALTVGPFGTYVAIAGVCVQATQVEIIATLTELKTLLPPTPTAFLAGSGTPVGGVSEPAVASPEFDKMPYDLAVRLRAEIDAIIVVIDAAPVT